MIPELNIKYMSQGFMGLGSKFSGSYCFYLIVSCETPSEHFLFQKEEETNLIYITYVNLLICAGCVPNLLKNFITETIITVIRRFSSIEKIR